MRNKAQMEMMGLVVIVILITLAMFFMISFGMKEDKTQETFTRKGLAASTMGALMKATTSPAENCGLIEFENDLLEDCAINFGSPDFVYQHACAGMNSCNFLTQRIGGILNETLGQQNKRYHLTAETIKFDGTIQDLLFSLKDPRNIGCPPKAQDKDEETYFVNTGTGQVKTTLRLC